MILSYKDLQDYLSQDAKANGRTSIQPKLFGDEIWKFIVSLRKLEYYSNKSGRVALLFFPLKMLYRLRWHRLSLKLGFSIPKNVFDKGLAIVHYGAIVVANNAKVGANCRIHEGVTIGATNGSEKAPIIGNNVFLASGAKIIGDISIADDVAIGANAVVVKSIDEEATSWGGVPAKKISGESSRSNLCSMLFCDD